MTDEAQLSKTCPACFGTIRLVSKEPWAVNQPIRRWEHDPKEACDFWEPTYDLDDER